jgi:flagellar biosynthesis/type III secretory pathway M-ring protein FliF/YscJ
VDTQATIVGIIVVVVVVLILAIFLVLRRRRKRRTQERRERTREEFGAEYERVTQERGSEKEAERELWQRRGRVERQVEPLSEESCQRYEERWGELERIFVDNPERSIEMADPTVQDVLEERNLSPTPPRRRTGRRSRV